jgi:type II secretory ATPase GspE/PulE/Tfp pilus assembly ATPase PilB-like protein
MEHLMPNLLLTSVEYSSYISIPKFIIFLVLFFPWLPLVSWVYQDAKFVETREIFWTAIVFAAGAAGVTIWLVVPLFIIGMMFYITAVAAASISYVAHRNTRVLDADRVLTSEHIKNLFVSKEKKLAALKNFVFVTANNNEVPMPEPRTPDFFGYKVAYDIFNDAAWRRASDIVFLPTHQDYNITYQIDGAALKQPSMTRDQMEYFTRFIKNLADLDANEKRKPQEGKFTIHQGDNCIEWEIATAGSTAGEHIKLKQIIHQDITRLPDIGLMPDQYEHLNKFRELKQGVFIVSGPEKAGVTTTFYALLRNHDAFINNINTLERQLSAELPNITQNLFALSDTATTTFDKKLQAMVRMGPDIVGVAGCQDKETAQIICQAAKDTKLMYVTLEADSVVKATTTWVKLVADTKLATETLLGVGNQRLLRRLCNECKQPYTPNTELLRRFNIPAQKAKVLYRAGKVQYDKHGKPRICENCQGTGFVGRIGVFETIMMDNQLRNAVRRSRSGSELGAQFRSAKMLYLQEQALRQVVAGTTAINEMVRVFSKSGGQKTKQV